MKLLISRLIFILIIFISPLYAFSQGNDVNVKLSLAEDKKVFKMDEPILLNLAFSAKDGNYNLDTINDLGSYLDEVTISPANGVFDWRGEYKRGAYFMNDVIQVNKLSEKAINVPLFLNNYFRIDKPGKYTVNVKTKRVSTPDPNNKYGRNQFVITTNPVSFEVIPMSKAEESAEVQRISEKLKTKLSPKETNDLSNQLAFLGGDTATIAKVWHFLNPQQDFNNGYHNLRSGLFISRNRPLVIKLLEEDLRNVEKQANYTVLHTLVQLRVMSEDENLQLPNNINSKEFLEYRTNRAAAIKREYLNELLSNLPLRKGKNKTNSAITILNNIQNEKNKSEYTDILREIIINDFGNVHIPYQELMLGGYWETIKSPTLIPALEKMLENRDPRSFGYRIRKSALKRLIELDEQKARPYVIEEIKNPNSFMDIDTLGSLKDEFFPETDQALLEQIRENGKMKERGKFVSLDSKLMLAARYSTDSIYGELLNIYKSSHSKWQIGSKGTMIGYFARHNDQEAVQLIEETLENLEIIYYHSFFSNLTKINYPKAVNTFLLNLLESDEPEKASLAVWIISKNGGKENKEIILARYKSWFEKWQDRREEFSAEKPSPEISKQLGFQINLVSSILSAKSWKLSDKEKAELSKTCFTESCLRYFPKD
ncbi:MAG: HEAT repeat domain-containing protein [Aridibacter sp.]